MKREEVEELFYGKRNQERRFTQDFPILPDVWIVAVRGQRRQKRLGWKSEKTTRLPRKKRQRQSPDRRAAESPASSPTASANLSDNRRVSNLPTGRNARIRKGNQCPY